MLEFVLPSEIEKRSFEIITQELGGKKLDPKHESIIKRVIHTSADFDYADALCFSEGVVEKGIAALKKGATIITDTSMAAAGINKKNLNELGGEVRCFIGDEDVAEQAQREGNTRSSVCMDKAASLTGPLIVAVGNAPTALIRLNELIAAGRIRPELIIGVPVGFVNVVESKEIIMDAGIPYIVARGRKGGSNVAAAICNALMLEAIK